MTRLKIIALALLLFFCSSLPATSISYAATYQVSEAQMQHYTTVLADLKADLLTLKENYNLSEQQIAKAEKARQKLEEALKQSEVSIVKVETLLTNALNELQNLKTLVQKLERENKTLKTEVKILRAIAIGEALYIIIRALLD